MSLTYGESGARDIRLNLRALESFRFDAPVESRERARLVLRRKELYDDELTITAEYPGPAEGALASGLGLLVTAGFFSWFMRRRGWRREPFTRPNAGADGRRLR